MVAVPDVTGKSKSLAISELKAAGFNVNTPVYHSDSTVASGHVISQDPPADSSQPLGTSVTITVSTGPQQVTVPDLTGLTSSHASDELTALGLTPNPQNGDPSPDVSHPAGTVESQDKTPGSKIDKNSTVTFKVYT
jgi:serine/threonine-protein kinase